jgi:hypothetical protein
MTGAEYHSIEKAACLTCGPQPMKTWFWPWRSIGRPSFSGRVEIPTGGTCVKSQEPASACRLKSIEQTRCNSEADGNSRDVRAFLDSETRRRFGLTIDDVRASLRRCIERFLHVRKLVCDRSETSVVQITLLSRELRLRLQRKC